MMLHLPKRLLAMIVISAITSTANAQVKTKIFPQGIPSARIALKTQQIPVKLVEAPAELDGLLKDHEKDNPTEYGNQFAVSKKVDLDVLANASATEENGMVTFVLALEAQKALNMSVQFSDFVLSENTVLSIYTERELTDSIRAKENNPQHIWATRVYQGNKLTITLKLPANERKKVALKIGGVSFGFKKFGTDFFGNVGTSVACNIDVVCPEAVGWENERNSVALIVVDGNESCTGSLIMNTGNTNIPYFLTANHCLSGNVANWVFQFQTWSATCGFNSGWREDIQFNGATLRANNAASDFALLELNNVPPAGSGITYSGWNRNTATPNGAVGLHHPAGDLMKFSRDFDPLGISSWGGTNNHWVAVFEQGTVQHGSSGSPLYDMNHRIVGQLHGDQQNQGNFCAQRRGEYGRFDFSWTGAGSNNTRLSNWLDPGNTGAATMNTSNIDCLIPRNLSISGSNAMCDVSGPYTLNALPAGSTVTWSVSPAGTADVNTPNNTVTSLTAIDYGFITLRAELAANGCIPGTAREFGPIKVGMPYIVGQIEFNSNGLGGGSTLCIHDYDWDDYVNTFTAGINMAPWNGEPLSFEYMAFNENGEMMLHNTIPNFIPDYTYRLPPSLPAGYYTFDCRYISNCGPGEWGETTMIYTDCSAPNARVLTINVNPNPASGNLNVTIEDPQKATTDGNKKESTRFMLYDFNRGTIVRTWTVDNYKTKHQLNIAGVQPGHYVLTVTKGKTSVSKHIQVK